MLLILTHEKSDFDAIASMLAAKRLFPEAVALLPYQVNRNVQQFLTLYWDALPFVRPADWRRGKVKAVILVDTHSPGLVKNMTERPPDKVPVRVIDHHVDYEAQPGWRYEVESIGATATLLVEQLQAAGIIVAAVEATLLLLGIYEDTGSLSYDTTTARDVRAAAWLLENEAQLSVVRRFLAIPLTEAQQALYDELLHHTQWIQIHGRSIVVATAAAPQGFDDEISAVTHRLRETLTPDALFVLVQLGDGVQVVARSTCDEIDVSQLARALGGGGHSRAAAAMVVNESLEDVQGRLLSLLPDAVEPATQVAAIMSYGVETLPTTTSVAEAAALMQRYGHEGYPIIDARKEHLVGLLTRRAVDRAMSHEMGHLPVSRIMKAGSVTVRPSDSVERVRQLMLDEGWGQIPVLPEPDVAGSDGNNGDQSVTLPIGIVTRTDVLNALFGPTPEKPEQNLRGLLAASLSPALWGMVQTVGTAANHLQMPLYFVGGIVRDMLLNKRPGDLDLVVEGDAIELVHHLQQQYGGEVHTHGRFGTAKWFVTPDIWQVIESEAEHEERTGNALLIELPPAIDFVTARKEFYRQPTALPDVERGSIKLDLHRRDFTINTLAIRLDGAHLGELLDFYGGRRDLERGLIRVLHSLSFIDDPTRILRAVRLEQRLGFQIEPHTAELIDDALPLLDRVSGERIRNEIELALGEADPVLVMERLDEVGVLANIYPGLKWPVAAAERFRRVAYYQADPLWNQTLADDPLVFYYYALWMIYLPLTVQTAVSRRLRTRNTTLDDVIAVGKLQEQLAQLSAAARPSEITRLLRPYPPRVLLTVRMLNEDSSPADIVDRYFREWRRVKTAVTGNDLRQMGLPPGPLYGRVLERLLDARLDGEVQDEGGEQALLAQLLTAEQS